MCDWLMKHPKEPWQVTHNHPIYRRVKSSWGHVWILTLLYCSNLWSRDCCRKCPQIRRSIVLELTPLCLCDQYRRVPMQTRNLVCWKLSEPSCYVVYAENCPPKFNKYNSIRWWDKSTDARGRSAQLATWWPQRQLSLSMIYISLVTSCLGP